MHSRASYLVLALTLVVAINMFQSSRLRDLTSGASAAQATGNIRIYWDINCTRTVYSMDWGIMSPGETKEIVLYIKNEGNESVLLAISPTNFSPTEASTYLSFTWSCTTNRIESNKTVEVTQSLNISPHTKTISNFSFDLTFEGRTYILGDINGDGTVDIFDALLLAAAYGSTPQDQRWNPNADLNRDGTVDIFDAIILSTRF